MHTICIINIPTNIYIIIFVVVKMKQHESLTILPSPIISRIGGYLTSLRNVHPSLSPLGFRRCGYFEEHFAFLLSITLPILFWYWIYLFPFYTSAYKLASHFLPFRVFSQRANKKAKAPEPPKTINRPSIITSLSLYNQYKQILLLKKLQSKAKANITHCLNLWKMTQPHLLPLQQMMFLPNHKRTFQASLGLFLFFLDLFLYFLSFTPASHALLL